MDWETARRRVSAVDLDEVDVVLYWSGVRDAWPHVEVRDFRQSAHYGKLFRLLIATSWVNLGLGYEWLNEPLERLRVYKARLADIIRECESTD